MTRQSISTARSSFLINVEVLGGQVASSNPGTALGTGFGSTTKTS
ncbi:hypothetical protein [Actinoplanes sp. TBRC 11911]|nr:hypothetical protein [Actinoplanes sp. TBRC 11911]